MGRRGGRPRKAGKRNADGRLKSDPASLDARRQETWDREERDAVSVVIEARLRHGVPVAETRNQLAGSFIGRLCLTKEISQAQYDALCAWESLARAHSSSVCGPAGDMAFDPNRVRGMAGGASEAKARMVSSQYRAAHAAVMDEQIVLRGTANLFAALSECVMRDREFIHMIGDLRHAANALMRHFRM